MTISPIAHGQTELWPEESALDRAKRFPKLRYMGSKHRLLPWIHSVLSELEFDSALDAFAGSGCVAYLLKSMGKRVVANDFLEFSHQIARATVENDGERLTEEDVVALCEPGPGHRNFIERTFSGIFFTPEDLRFLDTVWSNLPRISSPHRRALAIAALVRSCVKRQPRGVFTVAGDPAKYKDGRRDLRLSLRQHFGEAVAAYNATVFDNGRDHRAVRSGVFDLDLPGVDLVYMDPPYVPRSDDNCYIKRYHFLEGLASYWEADDTEIMEGTKVKKIEKRYTPFSYRRTALEAFDRMFGQFADAIQVLSYSSNGYPDLEDLVRAMKRHKGAVEVFQREHRYHFGTHGKVARSRAKVQEYLIVGH
jgi:DNA adenine methylase/adenine-specific DNA-methyltransferase